MVPVFREGTFLFKHPEVASSIVRDGKSIVFVLSRFCYFSLSVLSCVLCFGLSIVTGADVGPYGWSRRWLNGWLESSRFVLCVNLSMRFAARTQAPFLEAHGV